MPEVFCGECKSYYPRSRLVDRGEVNVSGGPVRYMEWLNPCRKGHNKQGYHCVHYEPNEVIQLREEKFNQEMKQLEEMINA